MDQYHDKVAGCWIGKCLGGGIGMPYEGVPYRPQLSAKDIVLLDVPNDDLELQLIWLVAMDKYGAGLSHENMGQIWLDHIPHGCDEYSIAQRNLRYGIMPPYSGYFDNFFADGMGAAIRSEVWAALFPGRPELAVHFAEIDASVDHYGNGVYGEIYMAAAESMAFCCNNIYECLDKARSFIAADCRLSMGLNLVFSLYDAGETAETAGKIIRDRLNHHNFTDCVMNIAYGVYALLWGKGDLLESIILSVNMGRDTDCTAASVGAFLGIIKGRNGLPQDMINMVKNELTVSDFVSAVPGVPLTLQDTVDMTCRLRTRLAAEADKLVPVPYRPLSDLARPEVLPKARFLVLDDRTDPVEKICEALRSTGKCPETWRHKIIEVSDLQFELSNFAGNANTLHLLTFMECSNPPAEGVVVSAAADVGSTLWFDDERVCNHHSRQLSIPSFHRVEGGCNFVCKFKDGERKLVHWKLYSCLPPLKAALMFGNCFNDHLSCCKLDI